MRAWQAVNEARYALEAWDPAAAGSLDQAAWGKELMAADCSGRLHRARRLAAQAAALARTPAARCRAALLLALLACQAGDHQAELQQTQVLAQLAPHSWITHLWQQHAAEHRCELR